MKSEKVYFSYSVFLLLIHQIKRTNAQDSAEYQCVPQAACPNGIPNPATIDPRIVTPGNTGGGGGGGTNLCPVGTYTCFGQGANSNCGALLAPNINLATDGQAQPGAHPWLAYITVNGAYVGAGVLLNNYHVLTAGHKAYMRTPNTIRVFMGVYTPTMLAGLPNSTVEKVIFANGFVNQTLKNDIAILKLATPMGLGVQANVNTACLPPAGASYVGMNCTVAGWGQTSFTSGDAPTNPMKQVTVQIVPYATCYQAFSSPYLLGNNVQVYLDENDICAGGQTMKDACTQDGGAPLVCLSNQRYYIAGLVIWGKNCGQPGVYGVYVSVPAFKTRIDTAIRGLNTNPQGTNSF